MEIMLNIPSNLNNSTPKDSSCQCYVTFEPLLCQKAYKLATFLNLGFDPCLFQQKTARLVLWEIPKQAFTKVFKHLGWKDLCQASLVCQAWSKVNQSLQRETIFLFFTICEQPISIAIFILLRKQLTLCYGAALRSNLQVSTLPATCRYRGVFQLINFEIAQFQLIFRQFCSLFEIYCCC